MNKRVLWGLVAAICLVTFILRLFISFQVQGFALDGSYFHLRQAESVINTGLPVYDDPLSFGGSRTLFPPAYYYFLAGFGLVFGVEAGAKILTALAISTLPFLVFAFAWHCTRNARASVISALASGFIPVFWSEILSISPNFFGIVLGFFLLYSFVRSYRRSWRWVFLTLLLISLLFSPIVLVFVLGLLIYLVLALLANAKMVNGEQELVLFSVIFSLWLMFVLFKRAFVTHGFGIFWQNIPPAVISDYFSSITVLEAVSAVSVVPFIAGIYITYKHLFKGREREVYVIAGTAMATGLLVWSRMMEPVIGLQILSVSLVLLFAIALSDLFRFIDTTKFSFFSPGIIILFIILIAAFSGVPSIHSGFDSLSDSLSKDDKNILLWVSQNTPEDAVVLGTLKEGNAIAYFAKRKNVADTAFILKKDAEQRAKAIQEILNTPFGSEALSLMKPYGVTHIFWSDGSRMQTGKDRLGFSVDSSCFPKAFSYGNTSVYSIRCDLGANA